MDFIKDFLDLLFTFSSFVEFFIYNYKIHIFPALFPSSLTPFVTTGNRKGERTI